jgi:hypothetical protein
MTVYRFSRREFRNREAELKPAAKAVAGCFYFRRPLKIDLKLIRQQLWPQALISPDTEAIRQIRLIFPTEILLPSAALTPAWSRLRQRLNLFFEQDWVRQPCPDHNRSSKTAGDRRVQVR